MVFQRDDSVQLITTTVTVDGHILTAGSHVRILDIEDSTISSDKSKYSIETSEGKQTEVYEKNLVGIKEYYKS